MPSIAGLLAYLFGISAVIGIELIGLTALTSPVGQTTTLDRYVAAPSKIIPALAKVFNKKQNEARVTRKPIRKSPTQIASNNGYGYAEETRGIDRFSLANQ